MKKRRKKCLRTIRTSILLIAIFLVLVYAILLSFKVPEMGTGKVITTGTLSFSQAGSAGVVLTNATIDFGSGYVNGSCALGYAILDSTLETNLTSNCWVNTTVFLASATYHRIQNTGSVPLKVNASANKDDAEEFFCGAPGGCTYSSTANISLKTMNAENNSCTNGVLDSFRTLLTESSNRTLEICKLLKFNNASNLVDIGILMQVPIDVQPGIKTILITYEAVPA